MVFNRQVSPNQVSPTGKPLRHVIEQIKASSPWIGLILACSGLLIGSVFAIHYSMKVPLDELVRDLSAVAELPPHTSFLSQTGLLLWSAAAAVCFFCFMVIPKTPGSLKWRRFLLVSGMLTLMLNLDDAFLVHERVLPHFGFPQNLLMGCYLGFMLAYLLWFRTLILNTEYILLAMALFFFGVSVTFDIFELRMMGLLVEDGAKIVGIVAWLVYFFRVGNSRIGVGPKQA
jgi:hypothetical protein